MQIEDISRVVHEANRAYCMSISEYNNAPWDQTSEDLKEHTRKLVKYILEDFKPDLPKPHMLHSKWISIKRDEGWKWGNRYNYELKLHPDFLDYDDLQEDSRRKSPITLGIVKALW